MASVGLGYVPTKSPPAAPDAPPVPPPTPVVQLNEPAPLVDSNWPALPSAVGKTHVTEAAKASGALKFKAEVLPPLFSVSTLAAVPLPLIVRPALVAMAPAVMVPVVFIELDPAISEAPLMVPAVTIGLVSVLLVKVSTVLRPTSVSVELGSVRVPLLTIELIRGAVRVLLVRVSVAASVTITPVVGKVALEVMPVPPYDAPKVPELMLLAVVTVASVTGNHLLPSYCSTCPDPGVVVLMLWPCKDAALVAGVPQIKLPLLSLVRNWLVPGELLSDNPRLPLESKAKVLPSTGTFIA